MKSGIIAVHKPEGISSAAVVGRVKRAFGLKKVGHTGTLDPFATGLLLCAINQGTRISGFFLDGHKRYTAQLCLGIETDTYDLTGKTEFKASDELMGSLTEQDVKDAVNVFSGVQDQVAPSFSALKHNGQPLYKLARQGIKIQKPPRRIEILSIDILSIQMPYVDIQVHCSAGTYIRSLAYDIGKKLGCGAHLSKLCRTGSSQFRLEDAIALDQLEGLSKALVEEKIISLSECLPFMPAIQVDEAIRRKIKFGQKIFKEDMNGKVLEPDQSVQLVDGESNLLAIVQLGEDQHRINYSCVFAT